MISRKGFTIIELAIVLVIVGILISLGISMIGPLAKRAKVSETQGIIDADAESLTGFASTNHRLPTAAEFAGSVKKAQDAWGNPLGYIVDNNLTAIPTGTTDAICGRKTTGITVRNCLTDNCATATGIDYNDITNVAFVIVSGGENFNVQSALASGMVTVYIRNGSTLRDDFGTLINRPERYDDIVKWVTLEELRTKTGCSGQQLKILNNELPAGSVTAAYGATIYGDGGIPHISGGNYGWCLQTVTGVLPAGFTANPNVVNANCQGLAEGAWGQANNLQISKAAGTGVSDSYSIMVYVRDNADTGGATNDNIASKPFVITISP